jgi:hypothetical protein
MNNKNLISVDEKNEIKNKIFESIKNLINQNKNNINYINEIINNQIDIILGKFIENLEKNINKNLSNLIEINENLSIEIIQTEKKIKLLEEYLKNNFYI